MQGGVSVGAAGCRTGQAVEACVERSVTFAAGLPPKWPHRVSLSNGLTGS